MSKFLEDIAIISGRVGWKGYTVDDLRDFGPWVIGANDITSNHKLTFENAKHISREKYEESPEIFIEKNDILVVKVGSTIGKVAIVNKNIGEACINPNTVLLKKCKENPFYLYYYLISDFGQKFLINNSSASAQSALNQTNLKKLPINFPTLNKQEQVVSILKSLDDKIELNNRINAELEAMAKTLYDYWFVQFDFPIVTSSGVEKPYKTSGGKMVYNETLKREIPEGWEVTVFNDWINDTKAGDWGKESIEGNYTERVYCIRGADINGINGKGEVKAPERFILKNNSSKKLIPNDFVVEISGGSPVQSTGRIALITESTLERFDTDIICSNFCKAVSIKNEKYIYNFKQEWQRLYDADVFFGFEGKTSGIKNFLFDSFMNSYSIVLPKKEIVEKYYEFAKSIDKKIQSNLKQNQELSALRDWLLPMLMNGQVKVG